MALMLLARSPVPKQLMLDTNILLEVWKSHDKRLTAERVVTLANEGVDLAVTPTIHDDIPRTPLSDRLRGLPQPRVPVRA